jgi:hypothetical protein
VFDRRRIPVWRRNMEVAVDLDPAKVTQQIIRNLAQAGKATG